MICEECTRYRGMKDGMVRCWNSQLFMLTSIPVASMRRKKECPKWTERKSARVEEPSRSIDLRTRISKEAELARSRKK